ncbi:hypothetical protein F5Y16DRAFT_388763 [Xylariaceae sp. FL0255]|nr:hypothetical protein F5Y16DRAFT_388763 [Xylariaceae sp. FL0255]
MPHDIVGHLVRRGAEYLASETFSREYIDQLRHDAQLYEQSGPDMELKPSELFGVFYTAFLVLLVISLIQYTIGHLMVSLAIIESSGPSLTTVIKYSDEPDAPIEKARSIDVHADVEVEIRTIREKPITDRIRSTTAHLRRIGGFFAQWRGLPMFLTYHFVETVAVSIIVLATGFGRVGQILASLIVSVALARIHMAWTHSVIAYPSAKSIYRHMPAYKDCAAVLLPALVHALAKQATVFLPIAVAYTVGLAGPGAIVEPQNPQEALFLGLRVMAPIIAYIFATFHLLLPASIALKRIEAICLPQGEETVVAFDRKALVGDLYITARGASRILFKRAWESVDSAIKWKIIRIHIKKFLIQTFVVLFGLVFVLVQLSMIGNERLRIFSKSAFAQLQLMSIEAAQKQQ